MAIAAALLAMNSYVFATDVNVAVVKSWDGNAPIFNELNSIGLTINTSLRTASSFTYDDLVGTGADILWLSNPAGGGRQYSDEEVNAIKRYANEGHSILGTFKVFKGLGAGGVVVDNRKLAPIFGLREDLNYNISVTSADRTFDILDANHALFNNMPNPYDSNAYPYAQVPTDGTWDTGDFGLAELLAQTSDKKGVITWYQTASYHAIYISEMLEAEGYGGQMDIQFIYNASTVVPEPSTIALLTLGGLALFRRKS